MGPWPMPDRFACPPDCGWCCTHLERQLPPDEEEAALMFRDAMRDLGVYACDDAMTVGLSVSNAEAAGMRAEADARGLALELHPRTFLLETRRRLVVPLDWHMPHVSCPFYKDFQCTAYDLRPLVCRAFPVMAPAPRWRLAPSCPLSEPTMEARGRGEVRLGSVLSVEAKARRAIDRAHAALDENAMRLLDAPGLRFARGLAPDAARERAARWRVHPAEALLADLAEADPDARAA